MTLSDYLDKYGYQLLTLTVQMARNRPDHEPTRKILDEMLIDLESALEIESRNRGE